MNGLSLFSGGAIGEVVFKNIIPDYRTVGYVEWDKYCQDTIRVRIKDGILDDAPIFDDIRVFNARYASLYAGKVDFISGGFPCQPFSVAGRQLGEADERNMWPATVESIRLLRPSYAFLENVPALLTNDYIRRIFGDLAEIGYDCEWDTISAAFVGAPHLRKRVWILAYPVMRPDKRRRGQGREADGIQKIGRTEICAGEPCGAGDVADTETPKRRRPGQEKYEGRWNPQVGGRSKSGYRSQYWATEPDVGRIINGLASRLDLLKTPQPIILL